MSKQRNKPKSQPRQAPSSSPRARWWALPVLGLGGLVMLAGAGVVLLKDKEPPPGKAPLPAAATAAAAPAAVAVPPPAPATNAAPAAPLEVAQAIVVTADLDYGPTLPSIAEALPDIERRYEPDDGTGRTFAILDAFGGPTPEGKLRISMHVSTEKPGGGALVFRRTGDVLWRGRIVPSQKNPAAGTGQKNLLILLDNGAGKTFTVDGSSNPLSVLDATLQGLGVPVRSFWPDGAEREVTFLYSTCGCPVKVMVRRVGDRTERTKELPVMFPDDPAAVAVIRRLMRWE